VQKQGGFSFCRLLFRSGLFQFGQAKFRRGCSYDFLKENAGKIELTTMMQMLRQHRGAAASWKPDHSVDEWTVCVHQGYGPIRANQTTGSLICRLSEGGDLSFATGTSAPCLSLFKPVWLDAGLPDLGPQTGKVFDEQTLWWRHELLHREVLKDFVTRSQIIRTDRDQLESEWLKQALDSSKGRDERRHISTTAFDQAGMCEQKWIESIKYLAIREKSNFLYNWAWRNTNRKAKIPV
jgi:dipeptidase